MSGSVCRCNRYIVRSFRVHRATSWHRSTASGRRDVLERGNWRIVAEFTEIENGKRSDRPALDKALAAARVRRVPLVVAKVDRLTRSVAFLSRLPEAGVDVRFADLPMIEGAAGKFLLQQMAAVAELEAGMISARTKAALAAAKRRGVKLGGDRGARLTAERPCRSERAAGRWISPPPFRSYRRRAVSPCGPLLPVWRSAVSLRRGAGSGPLSRWLDCWRSPVALSAAQASAPCERQSRRAVTLSSPSFGLLARFSAAAPDRRRQKSWAVALTREMPRWQR
jgi:hypothetical protein